MGREVGAYVCAETHGSLRDSARTWARLPRIRGDWVGCAFARKSWGILQKVKIIYIFRKTFKGVKMARSVGQRGALQSESQEVSPPWTHENADNQRTCHLTPEQTAESGKNPKKSPKATS